MLVMGQVTGIAVWTPHTPAFHNLLSMCPSSAWSMCLEA
jgi:hypothetical protein